VATQQIALMDQTFSAACAAAKPASFTTRAIRTASKHRESAECFIFQIT
jgi:hypothetical protein